MEGEGKGNGGPTYKRREVKGGEGGEKGEGGSPRLLRFFPGTRIVTGVMESFRSKARMSFINNELTFSNCVW